MGCQLGYAWWALIAQQIAQQGLNRKPPLRKWPLIEGGHNVSVFYVLDHLRKQISDHNADRAGSALIPDRLEDGQTIRGADVKSPNVRVLRQHFLRS